MVPPEHDERETWLNWESPSIGGHIPVNPAASVFLSCRALTKLMAAQDGTSHGLKLQAWFLSLYYPFNMSCLRDFYIAQLSCRIPSDAQCNMCLISDSYHYKTRKVKYGFLLYLVLFSMPTRFAFQRAIKHVLSKAPISYLWICALET